MSHQCLVLLILAKNFSLTSQKIYAQKQAWFQRFNQ
jgi:hypothetical protein